MPEWLITFPLPLELKAFLAHMEARGHVATISEVGRLKVHGFPELGWTLSIAGHGKTQFGIQTQHLIDQRPSTAAVLCCGSAGGLGDQVQIFDVIAATKTIEHDYRLKFVKRPDPEFPGDEQILAKLQNLKPSEYQIHLGPIASGDEDILEHERALELKTQTSAIAVAWEGAGGARAAKFSGLPYLEIRGITDTANNHAPVDFAANLQRAMAHVCDTLLDAFASPSK